MSVLVHRSAGLAVAALIALTGAACAQSGAVPVTPAQMQPPAGSGMPYGGGMMRGHHDGDRDGPHARMLKQVDTDGDGQISRAEFDAAQEAMRKRSSAAFDTADANKDGKLSPDEMRAFQQAMRPPGMGGGQRGPRPDPQAPRPAN
jgi:hypothetical protein